MEAEFWRSTGCLALGMRHPEKRRNKKGNKGTKLIIRSNTHIYVFYIELYKHITIYHGSIFMHCITNLPYTNMYLSVTLNCHSFKNGFT